MLRLTGWALNLIYAALLCAAAPWILWSAFRHGKYRRGTAAKLLGRAPRRDTSAPCLWFHAVSVGEVNLLATVIEEWQRRHPEWEIVISTTTDAAQALAAKKYPQFRVFYAPLDFSWAVANALRRIRPTVLVLAELELWPNLILAAHQQGARLAVINGRLGDRSFRGYRRLRLAMAVVLRRLQLVAAQDEASATRFRHLGACDSCLHVTGSVKFDGAATDSKHPRVLALRRLLRLPATATIWIVGSTQAPEEAAVIDIFRQLQDRYPHLHLLIVPRHPHRFDEVADLLADAGVAWGRRSEIIEPHLGDNGEDRQSGGHVLDETRTVERVWLIDSVGELWAWWGMADIATVGGSFGDRGGQNMIEPAAYGAAVSFGPHTWNFRDIVAALRTAGAAVAVDDFRGLAEFVERCLEETDYRTALGATARSFVLTQRGATQRTVDLLEELVADQSAPRQSAA